MSSTDAPIDRIAVTNSVKNFISGNPKMIINGKERGSAETIEIRYPATGEVIGAIPEASTADVDDAVKAARHQLEGGDWSRMSPYERQQCLLKLADLIEQNADEIAQLESVNSGKLFGIARDIEVGTAAPYVRYMAGWATKITGSTLQTSLPPVNGAQWSAHTLREPVGVIGAITPWNFPFMIAIWKLAPALACGNTTVIKPPEDASLTTLRLADLVLEAGVPAGVVNVVTGRGDSVGAALAAHPGVDKISFTGSTATGKAIARVAADRVIPCTLELGGKSPVIILDDCDPDAAAQGAAQAIFLHSGQVCVAGSRAYVQRGIYDAVVEKLAAIAGSMKVGDPLDPETAIGPLQNRRQQERVRNYIEQGVKEGATIAAGGGAPDNGGYFVEPTVLVNANQKMSIVREEIFGPVLPVSAFDDIDEAVRLANDTSYGLGASIWSNDFSRINRLIPKIKAGTVWVNAHSMVDPTMPHGGYKQSGLGREHGDTLIDQYTQIKTVCMAF